MIPDLLNYKLTGVAAQEYTNATTAQLVNINTGEWDLELIEKLGYPVSLFKKLSKPGTVVGKLTTEIAEKVGFDLTVIHAPSHDTASAFLASPAVSDKAIYLSSGTWSLMGIESRTPYASKSAAEFNITNEGGYDNTYRVLKNIMGLWIIQSIKKELGTYSFAEMSEMAEKCGDTKYRIDVNDLSFLAPDSMIAAIKKYCNAPDMPIDELLCCVYHSLAECYASLIKDLSNMSGVKYDSINIFGGGSQDNYLNYLTAKHCGIKVLAGPTEATSLGNLLSLMIADGVFTSVSDARQAIRNSFEIKIINS
jgi:rhamnulokinase